MNDLKNIKDILQNYEAKYDPQDWVKLKKDLPKTGMSGFVKTLLVAASVIVTVSTAIFFINHYDKKSESKSNEIISSTINNNDETAIINSINKDDTININNNDSSDTKLVNTNKNISEDKNASITIKDETILTNKSEIEDTIKNNENEDDTIDNIDKNNFKEENIIEKPIVNQIPDISDASFTTTIYNNCVPSTIQFEAKKLPKNCKLVWSTGDDTKVYGNKAEYTYSKDGKYYPEVNITYNNKLLKNIKLDEITLNSSTDAKILFENSKNLYYFSCDNEEDISLLWTIDNQDFEEEEVQYTFNKSGDYIVRLSIVNQFGCKSTIRENISIVIEHVLYFPDAFIPNANGINSEFGPIGENMDFENYQMVIVNSNGKVVFTSNNVNFKWNGKINNIGENAKPGYYLWEVKTMDEFGNVQTKKGRVNLIWN